MSTVSRYPVLFSPTNLGHLELRNRVVLAPMGTGYADAEHKVTERLIAYHVARARGGVGLNIVEHTAVHPLGLTGQRMLAILDDSFIPGFRRLTEAVHEAGGRIALQLQHGGRQADCDVIGGQCVAPSAVPAGRDQRLPREMTVREIREAVHAFGEGARRAREAGFDGVEVHMAHGYLGCSFLSPYLNRRTDAYGGTLQKRTQFAREVLQAIRKRCGADFPVWCRVSAEEFVEGGQTVDQMQQIATLLESYGYCAIHVSAAIGETAYMASAPWLAPEGHLVPLAEAVARAVSIPVIAVGNIHTPAFAEAVVTLRGCRLVALGRALLADPEWCNKALEGREHEIIPCLYCNLGCADRRRTRAAQRETPATGTQNAPAGTVPPATETDSGCDAGPEGLCECVTNPWTGHEADWPDWPSGPPAAPRKRVLVVGAGPAGICAAVTAARRGHEVTLVEQNASLGGRLLRLSAAAPGSPFTALLAHLARMLDDAGVHGQWQQPASVNEILRERPETVVIATGARPLQAAEVVVVAPHTETICGVDCLLNPEMELSRPVAVLGGDETGCLVAFVLARRGLPVMVFERKACLGDGMVAAVRHFLLQRLDEAGVQCLTSCRVVAAQTGVVSAVVPTGERRDFACGSIVVALGRRSVDPLSVELVRAGMQVHVIGDARVPGTLHDAMWEGTQLGRAL